MTKKAPVQLTQRGLEKLQEELRYLKEEKRAELIEYMGSALADGDLRESAAYDEARMLQSANEARIADLEEIINRAAIVENDGTQQVAQLGATLVLEDEAGEQETYHLVGTHEADVFENRISDESPLGKVLMGKQPGDKVSLPRGSKSVTFSVLDVRFE